MANLLPIVANCGIMADWFKAQGRYHTYTETPIPGDLVFFDWKGNHTKRDHVGIVEKVNADGTIGTIEGNTSVGNDSNGGEVMRRTRSVTYITGYVAPKYTADRTAAMILAKAVEELGTKESPANSNNVKYNTWFYGHAVSGATTYPWCCVFVVWIFDTRTDGATTATAQVAPATATQEVKTVTVTLNQLQSGSTGNQVKAVQRMLYSMGYYKTYVNGTFDATTEAAVKKYQSANGLESDGVVGPKTWASLLGV